MLEVVGVSFKDQGRMYYFSPNGYKLKQGVTVVVETDQGTQFGKVIKENFEVDAKTLKSGLKKIIRISNKEDYKKHMRNISDATEALSEAKKIVKEKRLPMQMIEATYTLDRDKLVFRFVADSRIDFRELVKDLASIYKVRIELRQVGVRDKAKEVGGCGPCGKRLCCSQFLRDLDSVSITMAKNQNISLNPNKINGVCGRLLCCLTYEDECYKKCRKNLPKIGDKVKTEHGQGVVIGLDILKQQYRVDVKDHGIVMVNK